MSKSIFYHAGCPVGLNVDIVHLGEDQSKIVEAEKAGVEFVPALLTPNGNVLHINFGVSISDVKG